MDIKTQKDDDMSPETKKWFAGMADWAIRGLIVAACGFIWQMYKDQNALITKIDNSQAQIIALQNEVSIIKAQMVGWDTLTRIERTLGLLAATGKGNQAMAAVSDVLKAEREARAR